MLGLFLILPVFVIEAAKYPGGDDPALIGLTMGIYGFTQAMLQFLYGMASDRLWRKRVIIFGLLLFGVGRFIAALAPCRQRSLPCWRIRRATKFAPNRWPWWVPASA